MCYEIYHISNQVKCPVIRHPPLSSYAYVSNFGRYLHHARILMIFSQYTQALLSLLVLRFDPTLVRSILCVIATLSILKKKNQIILGDGPIKKKKKIAGGGLWVEGQPAQPIY